MFDQPVSIFCQSRQSHVSRRRHVSSIGHNISIIALLALLTGCGTTEHFVARPQLTVDGNQQDTRLAVAQLFGSGTPYTVKLCEADLLSKECKPDGEGISATGVGGLFFPLILRVSGMHVSQERQSAEGLAIDVSFDSKADGIPPLCATAEGTIISEDNSTASIRIGNFYCNWMAVGNVLANAALSIDRVNLQEKTFTGYYKLMFHGTGNVAGSGYYKAVIIPKAT
jgi:hypothetical protein